MARKKISLNELHNILKKIIKEEYSNINLNKKASLVGHKISKDIINLINSEISDDVNSELWDKKNADTFFKFYGKILDTVMNRIYEEYADSFNTKAGAAQDEY